MFQKKKDAVYYRICKHSALDIEGVEICSAWKAVFVEKGERGEIWCLAIITHTSACTRLPCR